MGWFNFHVPETRRPDRNAGQAGNIGSGAVRTILPTVDRSVNQIRWPAPADEKVINRIGVSAFLCRLGPPRPVNRGQVAG